jgi:predicted nucleic acid-binding protein
MTVFADTSALFALLVQNDYMHVRAKLNFEYFVANNTSLLTSSYVLLETLTLLQRRVSLDAVSDFNRKIRPLPDVVWADGLWHDRAMQRLHAESRRSVSLTDCLSLKSWRRGTSRQHSALTLIFLKEASRYPRSMILMQEEMAE